MSKIPSILIALSGGADSAYLAWAAQRALGNRTLSLTALSPSFSEYDRAQVRDFVKALHVRHEFFDTHELENPAYRANSADRCYFCNHELFSALDGLARDRCFAAVAYRGYAEHTLDFPPDHPASTRHQVLAPIPD